MPGVSAANRAVKLPQLSVLANRRPGRLDQFTPEPAVSGAGDRAAIGFLSRRVLGRNHAQKSRELAHVFKLPPVANTGQELARHYPADPTNAHHILHALRQFGIALTELADLFGHLHDLLLRKLHVVEQLIEVEAHTPRALKFPQLAFNFQRPAAPSRSRWKSDSLEEQQRLNPLLHPRHFTDQGVTQLGEMAKLSINGRRHVNAPELSTAQALRQASAVEAIGFDSLPGSSRNHRRCRHQAVIPLGRKPIIQSIPGRSSLIHKRNPLIGKMLAHVSDQVFHTVRHVQRSYESLLMVAKSHRDTFLVYVQAGKHIILLWYKCFLSHAECLLVQCLLVPRIVPEHSRLGVDIHHTSLRKASLKKQRWWVC